MRSSRNWLLVFFLFMALAVAAYFALRSRLDAGKGLPEFSVYSNEENGLAMAAKVLRELGLRPVAVTRPIQHTQHQGTLFTGFRVENRFLLFVEPHKINPVLYFEYEHLNGADKVIKEVVGFDGRKDLEVPDSETRREHKREIEPRLILSSQVGEWNLTGNLIGEKNLKGGPWEFGYAAGLSRPLGSATGTRCRFCPEKFAAGVEVYGGLGTARDFTLSGTSHYVAPLFLWTILGETMIQVSPAWGLTDESVRMLFRVGVSTEIDNIGGHLRKLFHK